MKIMITGAAGFIGSHLCEYLVSKDLDVVGVDNFLPNSYSSNLKVKNWNNLKKIGNLELFEFDLRSDLPNSILNGVDLIVNLAAMPGLMKSWSEFDTYNSCNILLTEKLVRRALDIGVSHFIQISTSSVYGIKANGKETGSLKPISPYGVTKLAAEEIVKAYCRNYNLDYTILRYFSVYGPRQRPDMAYFKLIHSILNSEFFEIYGDGTQSRSNTYVLDCVEATYKTILFKPKNEVINIAGNKKYQLLETINILEELTGKRAKIVYKPSRPGDQYITCGDISKAKKLIDYDPKTSLKEGLKFQLDWQKKLI